MSGRELNLSIKLTADGKAFVAGIDGAMVELKKLGDTAEGVGRKLGDIDKEVSARNKLEQLFKATRTEAESLTAALEELEGLRPFASTARELEALERATTETKLALAAQTAEAKTASAMQDRLSNLYRNTRTEVERLQHELAQIEETRPFAKTPAQLEAVERAATSVRGRIAELSGEHDHLTGRTKLTTQQMQTLQYTASDVAASLASGASPFTILLQQGGQVAQVFPGVVGRFLAVGAAAVGIGGSLAIVGTRMAQIARETRELTGVLKAAGDQAGVTGDELRKIAIASTANGASRTEAYEAALTLARNRQLRGTELFRDILNLAPDVAAALGVTIPEAAKKMGDAFAAGAAGVRRLDEELGFLSPEQAKQVRLLNEQGDRAGALSIAMQALQQRMSGTAKSMKGDWGVAVHEIGLAWDAFVDRIASSDLAQRVAQIFGNAAKGVRTELERNGNDEVGRLRSEIAQLDRDYARLPEKISGVQSSHEALIRRRIELQQRLNALTGQDNTPPGSSSAPQPTPRPGNANAPTNDEQKRIDELRHALDRERDAMRGTSAERQVRLAGLQAEREALEAGRSPEAAKAERLIAEDRARLALNTAIGDTTRQLSAEARANLAVADAYLVSADSGQRAEAMREAMLESLQTGVAAERRAKDILMAQSTALAASSAKALPQLQKEVALRQTVADAALQGGNALARAEVAAKAELATLPERIALKNADAETTKRLTAIIKAKTEAVEQDSDAEKKKNIGQAIQGRLEEIEAMETQLRVMGLSNDAQELAIARQQAIIELRRQGIDVTANMTDEERKLAGRYIETAEKSVKVSHELKRQQALFNELADLAQSSDEFPEHVLSSDDFVAEMEGAWK